VRIVVAGFGRVGRTFVSHLLDREEQLRLESGVALRLVAVATSRSTWLPPEHAEPAPLRAAIAAERFQRLPGRHEEWNAEEAIRHVEADLLVEATGGDPRHGEPATTNVRAALEHGLHVVAASKGAFVHGRSMHDLAARRGLQLRVGAAAGAALPTIDLARYALAGTRIESVEGILNGTSNYILGAMAASGSAFADALHDAQVIGAAEPNPELDVDGVDTACKLVIIANAVLGADIGLDDVPVHGISGLEPEDLERAAARGRTIRLLGTLRRGGSGWQARVEPTPLPLAHPLASVSGFEKGISYTSDLMDRVTAIGGRSDPNGAAAALTRDILNLVAVLPEGLSSPAPL
jgi:homoserine dehydrogenase